MFNLDVRDAIKQAGVFGYEAAAALGMSETSFSRKMARAELSEDEKERIFDAIGKMAQARSNNGSKTSS